MKQFFRSRAAAVIGLAIVIALSVPLGARRSVASLARKTEKIYAADHAQYGCAKSDVTDLTDYADQLSALASAVLGDDSMKQPLADARAALSSPIGQEAVPALYRAATIVYNKLLIAPSLTEQQHNSAISYYYEMTSTMQRLANNAALRRAAEKYNAARASFPGSLAGGADAVLY